MKCSKKYTWNIFMFLITIHFNFYMNKRHKMSEKRSKLSLNVVKNVQNWTPKCKSISMCKMGDSSPSLERPPQWSLAPSSEHTLTKVSKGHWQNTQRHSCRASVNTLTLYCLSSSHNKLPFTLTACFITHSFLHFSIVSRSFA